MKRVVPICVALAVAAGLFLLLSGGDEEDDKRSRRRSRQARKRPPIVVLTGSVRNERGPVRNATVFLLDKKAYGGDRNRLPHVVTGADGRFRLRTRKTEKRWIGVVHERHMHAHQDLDSVDTKASIDFVLQPARRIVATVIDENDEPVANQLVQLTPWPPIDMYELPDPKHRQGEHTAISDARGRATFWVGSPGPVTLRPELDGYFPEPHEVALTADESVAVIKARAGIAFPVQVSEDGPLDVSLFCGAPDYVLHSVHATRARGGKIEGRWPPGAFGVLLTSRTGGTCWLDAKALADGSGPVQVPPMGSARFDPPLPPDAIVYVGRTEQGAPWARVGSDGSGRWALCQGRFALMAFRPKPGLCAVRAVEVVQTTTAAVDWQPGQWINLKDHAISPDARRLRVVHEVHGALPLIGRTKKRVRTGFELLHIHLGRPDAVVELGPYPAGKITIRGVP